jgi:YVTN family beta-propeller protein
MSREDILALPISSLGDEFAAWDDRRFPMSLEAAYSELVGLGPTLLVVNKSDDTLAFIDTETNGFRGLVPTGPGPHEVAATPDGKLAYVTNYMSGRPAGTRSWLTVVDLEAMAPVRDLELKHPDTGEYLSAPHGIMITPDGSDLWVTAEGSGAVARISLPDERVASVYETGQRVSHQVVPLPDGSKAYVANIGSGSVSVVDVAAGTVRTVECQPGTEGIDVKPDGSEVWATNREAGTISIIDTSTDRVIETVTSGDFPIRVKFTPDGRHALVSNARDGEVAVFDAATREVLRRIPTGTMPVGLLVLPNGSKAYAANTASDRVSVIDLAEWSVSGTISPGKEPDGLSLAIRQ